MTILSYKLKNLIHSAIGQQESAVELIDILEVVGPASDSFVIIQTDSGSSPVADSPSDILTLIGDGTITTVGNSSTDTITLTLGTVPINKGGTGQITANASLNALLPSQTSNSGKVLSTDGTNTSWTTVTDTGITQLTGNVTAGPGSGSQVATISSNVIIDSMINSAAAIAGTKISPNFGSQTVTTSGTVNIGSLTASKTVATDASKNLVSITTPIIVASGDLTSKTTAQSSVVTYTTPNDSTVHSFRVGGYMRIASISGGAIQVTVDFQDEGGSNRTLFFFPAGSNSPTISATGFSAYVPMNLRCNPNTAITVKTVFQGVPTTTYDVGGTIESLY